MCPISSHKLVDSCKDALLYVSRLVKNVLCDGTGSAAHLHDASSLVSASQARFDNLLSLVVLWFNAQNVLTVLPETVLGSWTMRSLSRVLPESLGTRHLCSGTISAL